MPPKKKKGGKEGKAKKTSNGAANKTEDQQGTPDTQMQQLKIDEDSQDEDALLEAAIKLAAAEKKCCR